MENQYLDFFEPTRPWSVSELTQKIRSVLEGGFSKIWLKGEISNFRPASSGHVYFSLKDSQSCIAAAIFGWSKRKAFELKDGLEVLVGGKISVFGPRGSYQIIIDSIEPLGAGALQLAFEQLKNKLANEGLFEQGRKRRLPLFPHTIVVVTSPTGAVIQDMVNILKRRAPHIKVIVIPSLVQGTGAPEQLIQGINLANEFNIGDVIVIARGGGTLEDLWAFNHENLARAIVASKIPVISAVGHETDFTISDFVADLRAPTPSAAAEIISNHWVVAMRWVQDAHERVQIQAMKVISQKKLLFHHVAARLVSPKDRLREQAQKCDEYSVRIERAIFHRMEARRNSLVHLAGKLEALSPLQVLKRGFSIIQKPDGKDSGDKPEIIRSVHQVSIHQSVVILLSDGEVMAKVLTVRQQPFLSKSHSGMSESMS